MDADPQYVQRVQEQIAQYAENPADMHDLPPMFQYWSVNYIAPRMEQVFGPSFLIHDIFADRLTATTAKPDVLRFASIGSGESATEIQIAETLLKRGISEFTFDCYELSPVLNGNARDAVQHHGLPQHFEFVQCDINNSRLRQSYNGIMAHHSLHHLVELEAIFDDVKARLIGDAQFVLYDVIGRNGHMRWPETLAVVEKIWAMLPIEKRYNHQFKTTWEKFVNWDCSNEGFEGIRAQEILLNLVNRFHFSHCVAFGGLTEVFVDRGFGRNYASDHELDRAFVDFVEFLNSLLIDAGTIKPTIMFASMGNVPTACKCDRHLTPLFCLRNPT